MRLMHQQQKAVSTATNTKTLNLVLLKVSWEPKLAGMLQQHLISVNPLPQNIQLGT